MEFPQIKSLVPEKEHFDSSVIGEGIWLTSGHVNAIESALEARESSVQKAVETIQSALTQTESTLEATQEKLTATELVVTEKDTTISTQSARIEVLEAQVVELGAKPSGTGSNTIVKSDTPPASTTSATISFDSPEHPANIQADQLTGRKIDRSI